MHDCVWHPMLHVSKLMNETCVFTLIIFDHPLLKLQEAALYQDEEFAVEMQNFSGLFTFFLMSNDAAAVALSLQMFHIEKHSNT